MKTDKRPEMDQIGMDQKEVLAYIQQQMSDLAPHMDSQSPLQLKVVEKQGGFEAELTVDHEAGKIQILGKDKDLFDAIKSAKEGLLDYFVELEDHLNPNRRSSQIQYICRHGTFHIH